MFDFLNDDGFGVMRLSRLIQTLPYVPARINELGLFDTDEVDTTMVAIEFDGEKLIIIPPTPRGGPGTTIGSTHPKIVPLVIPHFEINDALKAEALQNKREPGTEGQLRTVQRAIMKKLIKHRRSVDLTEEHARMGALKGVVTYADGSTLDLYDPFGIAAPAAVPLAFATDDDTGRIRTLLSGVSRTVIDALGGQGYTELRAFCGNTFFDSLLGHPEVRNTYKNTSQAEFLRSSYVGPNRGIYASFEYGGIIFENYRGVSAGIIENADKIEDAGGSVAQIGASECRVFPLGVPDLFTTTYAPADYMETVNTIGERIYSKQKMQKNDKGMDLDTQTNQLNICTRPEVLIELQA